MEHGIFFVGIDVDDKNYHGSVYSDDKIVLDFKCRPTVGHLLKRISEFGSENVRLCYEATYLGFSLQRALSKEGYHCDVIAPSLMPEVKGRKQKTDRLDSRRLAEYYKNGLLTAVHIPDEEDEIVRNFVRSRHFLQEQVKRLKLHILGECRRFGIDYKQACGKPCASHWTEKHRIWFKSQIEKMPVMQRINFECLLSQLEFQEGSVERYDARINDLAGTERYKRRVEALSCYRGLSTLSSMTIVSEIGDVRRFRHPRQLTSYAGLDIVEYSSGGRERKYGISKQGNRHLRRVVVEASQQAKCRPQIGKRLKQARKFSDEKFVSIAERCMNRLYKRSWHLLNRGKSVNKVKVACGREMLSFIWESLHAAMKQE